MKSLITFTFIAVLFFLTPQIVLTQTEITLDYIDGLYSPGQIEANTPITFHLRATYNPGDSSSVTGFINGFRIYSPDGATWQPLTWDTANLGWSNLFDLIFTVDTFGVTGTGEDTISFGGSLVTGNGFQDGFDQEVWTITTMVDSSDAGKTLCLDSSWIPPSNSWTWSTSGPLGVFAPGWDGPHCETIHAPCPPPREPGNPRPSDGETAVSLDTRLCWDSVIIANFDNYSVNDIIGENGACYGEPDHVNTPPGVDLIITEWMGSPCLLVKDDGGTTQSSAEFLFPDGIDYNEDYIYIYAEFQFDAYDNGRFEVRTTGIYENMVTVEFRKDGGLDVYDESGTVVSLSSPAYSLDQVIPVKVVYDIENDTYDVYFNNTLIVENRVNIISSSNGPYSIIVSTFGSDPAYRAFCIDNIFATPDRIECIPTYDVLFGTTNPPTDLIYDDKYVPGCDPSTLTESDTYYWQVIASVDAHTTNGDVWSFITCYDTELLILDANDQAITNTDVTISTVEQNPPLLNEELLGVFQTNGEGKVIVPCVTSGKWIKAEIGVHEEPARRHQDIMDVMYTVVVDNAVFDPFTSVMFYDEFDGSTQQTIKLGHTTMIYNLVVSTQWNTSDQYILSLRDCMRLLSNHFYDITDGQMRLGSVMIFDGGQQWADCDIQIHLSNHMHNTGGINRVNDNESEIEIGSYVFLPVIARGTPKSVQTAAINEILDLTYFEQFRITSHELGHYLLGYDEEYQNYGEPCYHALQSICYGFMDLPEINDGPRTSEMSRESHEYDLEDDKDTKQWHRNQQSCWNQFEEKFEKDYGTINARILKPTDLDAPSDFLEGPNDDMSLLDYDVGSLVNIDIFYDNEYSIEPLLEVKDENGIALLNSEVRLLDRVNPFFFRILVAGKTNTNGQIRLRGYNPNEDIIHITSGIIYFQEKYPILRLNNQDFAWFIQDGDPIDSAGVLLFTMKEINGQYPFIQSWQTLSGNLEYSVRAENLPPIMPEIEIIPDDTSLSGNSYSLSLQDSVYSAQFPDNIGGSGYLILQTADDSLENYAIYNQYTKTTIGDTDPISHVVSKSGLCVLTLDSICAPNQELVMFTNDYPPKRNGIENTQIQAGDMISFSIEGYGKEDNLLGINAIEIYYNESILGDSTIADSIASNLQIYRWNTDSLKWAVVGGEVDTTNDYVSTNIEKTGVYAVFTTDSTVCNLVTNEYQHTGDTSNSYYGFSVVGGSDLSSDGIPDFVVGAPYDGLCAESEGSIFIYDGVTGSFSQKICGPAANAEFGYSLDIISDMNGDGQDDLLVGSPNYYDHISQNDYTGGFSIYFSNNWLSPYNVIGGEIGEKKGFAVANAGDVNNDGKSDFTVSSPLRFGTGEVFVYSGDELTYIPFMTLSGEFSGDEFGYSIDGLGDINGDNHSDLIIGAPHNDGSGESSGKVYIYSGIDGSEIRYHSGSNIIAKMGISVAGIGDIDGDDVSDYIIGSPGDETGGSSAGAAFVYSGFSGIEIHSFYGLAQSGFGHSVASAGDVNGDGVNDLIIGAPLESEQGAVYIYSGSDGSLFMRLEDESGQWFSMYGGAVGTIGDVNEDCFGDVIVGASLSITSVGTATGQAFIYQLADDCNSDPICSDNCCQLRGDVAEPKDDIVLVNDIVSLVDYLFKGGVAPTCLEEGDCAVPLDGLVLVNDIVWLVDYLFKGGSTPPDC